MHKCKIFKTIEDWKNDENFVELFSVKNVESKDGVTVMIHCYNRSVAIPATFVIDVFH